MPHAPLLHSPRRSLLALALLAACVGAWSGCQAAFTVPPETALDKLLRPVTTSADSVTLEIFEARIPLEKDQQAEAVWQQVDEQCFDAELRRRLLANGLRAGVIGGTLPDELSALLGLQSEMPESTGEQVITANSATPQVTRRVVQVNRREPREIQACDVHNEAILLFPEARSVGGKTYREVEGRYMLQAQTVPGQRVAIRLSPELHHGQLRNRYSGSDTGKLMIMPSREREPFAHLAMSVELAAGEMMIVSCLPEAESTLGGFLQKAVAKGRTERKFLLVRVLESPPSEILAGK